MSRFVSAGEILMPGRDEILKYSWEEINGMFLESVLSHLKEHCGCSVGLNVLTHVPYMLLVEGEQVLALEVPFDIYERYSDYTTKCGSATLVQMGVQHLLTHGTPFHRRLVSDMLNAAMKVLGAEVLVYGSAGEIVIVTAPGVNQVDVTVTHTEVLPSTE